MIGAATNEPQERSTPDHSSKTLMTCDFTSSYEGLTLLRQVWSNRVTRPPTPPNELEGTPSRAHRATPCVTHSTRGRRSIELLFSNPDKTPPSGPSNPISSGHRSHPMEFFVNAYQGKIRSTHPRSSPSTPVRTDVRTSRTSVPIPPVSGGRGAGTAARNSRTRASRTCSASPNSIVQWTHSNSPLSIPASPEEGPRSTTIVPRHLQDHHGLLRIRPHDVLVGTVVAIDALIEDARQDAAQGPVHRRTRDPSGHRAGRAHDVPTHDQHRVADRESTRGGGRRPGHGAEQRNPDRQVRTPTGATVKNPPPGRPPPWLRAARWPAHRSRGAHLPLHEHGPGLAVALGTVAGDGARPCPDLDLDAPTGPGSRGLGCGSARPSSGSCDRMIGRGITALGSECAPTRTSDMDHIRHPWCRERSFHMEGAAVEVRWLSTQPRDHAVEATRSHSVPVPENRETGTSAGGPRYHV